MDLKSGVPYWPTQDLRVTTWAALDTDLDCEVAIVGGVAGALAAWHLAEAGIDTALLERRRVAAGSTSASTALLLYEPDLPLMEMIKLRGEADAVRAWQLCRDAVCKIACIVQQLDDACGFEWKPSLYLASNDDDAEELKQEYELRRRHGFALELLTRRQIEQRASFSRPAALRTTGSAQIDPYRLAHRLVEAAAKRSVRVFEKTAVSIERAGAEQTILRSEQGCRIRARRVVVAAGYETQQHLLRRDVVELASSYALASAPLSSFDGWPEACLIWETARPYLYLRTTTDGRAIVGGADEEFHDAARRDRLIGAKCAELQRRFRELFPQLELQPA